MDKVHSGTHLKTLQLPAIINISGIHFAGIDRRILPGLLYILLSFLLQFIFGITHQSDRYKLSIISIKHIDISFFGYQSISRQFTSEIIIAHYLEYLSLRIARTIRQPIRNRSFPTLFITRIKYDCKVHSIQGTGLKNDMQFLPR